MKQRRGRGEEGVGEKFRFFIASKTTCQRESPHKFSARRPINRARVLLLGCKTSRCRASIAGVIFRLFAGTPSFLVVPLSSPLPPPPPCSVFQPSSPSFSMTKTPRCQTPVPSLCVLFFTRIRGRFFLSRFRPASRPRSVLPFS